MIYNKGIGYLLELLPLSEEREELWLLLLLELPEEERLSVCPLETLLRVEELLLRPLLRFELPLLWLLEVPLRLVDVLRLSELEFLLEELLPLLEELLSFLLFEFTLEPELLLLVRPLSRLGLVVVVVLLLPAGLRLELDEPEFVSGRRLGVRSPSPLLLFPVLLGVVVTLFGLSSLEGVEGRPEVDGLCSVSGRGRVDVPGREEPSGREELPGRLSGRCDVPGRVDVPGFVVEPGLAVEPGRVLVPVPGRVPEPGREEFPGRVGALCGREELFGRKRTEPKSERR